MAPTLNAWLCLLLTCCFEPLKVSGLTSQDSAALDSHGDTQLPSNKSAAAPTKLLMRSVKRGKWAAAHHAQAAQLGKAAVGVHPAPRDASHSLAGIKNLHDGQGQNADCDEEAFDKPKIEYEYWRKQPQSQWWRIRMYQPCQLRDILETTWHINSLRFYNAACDELDGTNVSQEIPVVDTWVSGEQHVRHNKQLSADYSEATYWEGIADKDGQIWYAVRLNTSAQVRCVKFAQCMCEHSARWVLLEFSEDYRSTVWTLVPLEEDSSYIGWGNESLLAVKKAKGKTASESFFSMFGVKNGARSTLVGASAATLLAIMHTMGRSLSL